MKQILFFALIGIIAFVGADELHGTGNSVSAVHFPVTLNLNGTIRSPKLSKRSGPKVWPVKPAGVDFEGSVELGPEAIFPDPRKRDLTIDTQYARTVSCTTKSSTAEPAVASNGQYWYYTMNWDVAKSTNYGQTWTLIDPSADMPNFCCDQDVIFSPNSNIFLWFRQDSEDQSGQNFVRITVLSADFSTQWSYDITPTGLNAAWTGRWFDFPHISITNSYFFFTTNVFSGNSYTNSVIVRIPLSSLAAGTTITPSYVSHTLGTSTPAEGCTTTMYLAVHVSYTQMRIYSWPDASGTSTTNTVAHAAYTGNAYSCASPDSYNWCGRMDGRPLGAVLHGGILTVMWNAPADATHTHVYIAGIDITVATMLLLRAQSVYSSTYDFGFPHLSVNGNGDIALSLSFGNSATYVSHAFGVYDSSANQWFLFTSVAGNKGSSTLRWGDYLRVRPNYVAGAKNNQFIGSGFVLQGGYCQSGYSCSYVVPVAYLFSPQVTSATGVALTTGNTGGSGSATTGSGSGGGCTVTTQQCIDACGSGNVLNCGCDINGNPDIKCNNGNGESSDASLVVASVLLFIPALL